MVDVVGCRTVTGGTDFVVVVGTVAAVAAATVAVATVVAATMAAGAAVAAVAAVATAVTVVADSWTTPAVLDTGHLGAAHGGREF